VPAIKVRFCAPLTVLLKVKLPEPPLFETLVVPVKVIGFANEIAELVVASVPERETAPPPLWVNAPEIEVLGPAARVKVPVLVIATGPAEVVIKLPFRLNAVPVSAIPPTRFVFKVPSVVSPVPAVCVMVDAVMFWAVITSPLSIVKAPRRVVAPTFADRVMSPAAPAFSSNVLGPLIVLANVIFVEFAEESMIVGLLSVAGPAKEMLPPAAIVEPRVTAPLPVWLNAPLALTKAPPAKLSVPELAIETGPDPVVVILLLTANANAVPARLIPSKRFVLRAPLKVVVPVPAI